MLTCQSMATRESRRLKAHHLQKCMLVMHTKRAAACLQPVHSSTLTSTKWICRKGHLPLQTTGCYTTTGLALTTSGLTGAVLSVFCDV